MNSRLLEKSTSLPGTSLHTTAASSCTGAYNLARRFTCAPIQIPLEIKTLGATTVAIAREPGGSSNNVHKMVVYRPHGGIKVTATILLIETVYARRLQYSVEGRASMVALEQRT